MCPIVQKVAIVAVPAQRGGEEVVTHISSRYWQHTGALSFITPSQANVRSIYSLKD